MARTLDAETLIKPARFAHFVLRVRNLQESIGWYQTVLGMEIVHRAEKIAFMTYDDEPLPLIFWISFQNDLLSLLTKFMARLSALTLLSLALHFRRTYLKLALDFFIASKVDI